LVAQVCRLPVHVTADIEDGYSDDPDEVAELVAELAAIGVEGINLRRARTDTWLIQPFLLRRSLPSSNVTPM
jgi:2-methylisocitrate lyase-like PEP mutase family enzyme